MENVADPRPGKANTGTNYWVYWLAAIRVTALTIEAAVTA